MAAGLLPDLLQLGYIHAQLLKQICRVRPHQAEHRRSAADVGDLYLALGQHPVFSPDEARLSFLFSECVLKLKLLSRVWPVIQHFGIVAVTCAACSRP